MSNRLASKFVAELNCDIDVAIQIVNNLFNCSDKTLEQIVSSLNIEVNFDTQIVTIWVARSIGQLKSLIICSIVVIRHLNKL